MISLKVDGGIAIATLCHAPVNAISEQWMDRFEAVLDEVEGSPAVKVLWIRSPERVFCAGADLAWMRARFDSERGRREMIDLTRRMQRNFSRIEDMPKVSLAEIGGAAMGGGFELALACDLRIIADSAKVALPEARLGLLPAAGGTQRMTRICGESVARRLILGAEAVSGVQAVSMGLAQWSAPAAEIEALAWQIAGRIADLPGDAVSACKRCIGIAVDAAGVGYAAELAASAQLLATDATQQRVRRFLEKQLDTAPAR